MENKIEIFNGLRILEVDGEILINLEDISRGLGFVQYKNDKEYIRKDRVEEYLNEFGFPTNGESDIMVPESVFYLLAMKANNETAKQFQIKVATKIIPEYRKQKKQSFSLPQTFSEALRLLADTKEREEKALLELNTATQKIIADQPKVLFADSVTGSSNSILVRQFAKDLCDSNFEIGQNRLFEWFRQKGYLNSENEPFQNYVSQGLFEVITRTIGSGNDTFTTKTTKVTGRGQVYFAKKIKENN